MQLRFMYIRVHNAFNAPRLDSNTESGEQGGQPARRIGRIPKSTVLGRRRVTLVVRPQKRNMIAGRPIEIDYGFFPTYAQFFTALASIVPSDDRMAARRTASFGRPYNYSQIQYPETGLMKRHN